MRSLVSTTTIDDAEVILGSIRRSVLVALQSAETNGNRFSILDATEGLSQLFAESDDPTITASVAKITAFSTANGSVGEREMLAILDSISTIESALIGNGLVDGEASEKLFEAIDDSFREFDRVSRNAEDSNSQRSDANTNSDDEVDIELLEVFAEEASQLISDLEINVERLATPGEGANALWEIRRIAHTFKGAAGAVGLSYATRIAHRIEDVIEFVESSNADTKTQFRVVLKNAIGLLRSITDLGQRVDQDRIDAIFEELDKLTNDAQTPADIAGSTTALSPTNVQRADESTPRMKKPVVRVSLAVLDSIEARMRQLVNALSEMQIGIGPSLDKQTDPEFARQFEDQRILAMSIDEELRAIRLVEFATLTTRLQRAVRVACEEEHKTAEILIENGELRIDTVLLDSLVEPLMHLLRNSVVHGLESSETRRLIGKPESGLVRINLSENIEGIEILIADDGRGIDVNTLRSRAIGKNVITEQEAAKLSDADAFELIFHQGLSTANNLTLLAGRGVGMSIVREAITSLGGSIAVESKTNHGTTFKICIPTRKTDEIASEPTDPHKVRVLTVDDSASVRKLNSAVIEKCGCTPIAAEDVREAMRLLAEGHAKPDLILTDLEMPVIDGFEFIAWLKNRPALSSIPVVVVSTKNEPEIVTEALRLGAEACITKPLDMGKLEIALRESVRSN